MKLNVAIIQMACSPDIQENIDKICAMVTQAADSGAQMVCLQELYTSRYFPQTVDAAHYGLAKPLTDRAVTTMQAIAREKKIVMVVPVYEEAQPGIYFNTAVVVDADGTILGKYRKTHIPEGPQYLEKFYFTPGDLGYPVFKTAYGVIGVAICWDEWFPEVSRILSLKGAQIIFYPSAIGSEPDHPDYSSYKAWQTVIKSHGIANGLFIAAPNRVGAEDEMAFYGGSFISNPFGDVLAKAGDQDDEIVSARLDLDEIKAFRDIFQFHRDRRCDTYGEILKTVIQG